MNTDKAGITLPLPTTIDIEADVNSILWDEESLYYNRTIVSAVIGSTTKFDRLTITHLGFHAYRYGKRQIWRKGDKYHVGVELSPNGGVQMVIPPFGITLSNIGDSFLKVGIRMQGGMDRCKMTILQEEHQIKSPRVIDDFIEFEGVWYATVTINCVQKLRIEEL